MGQKNKLKSMEALTKLSSLLSKSSTILDIGAGETQVHSNMFRNTGFKVDTVDFFKDSTYIGDFNKVEIPIQYDAVWASHCLEHQLNVNIFLKKIVKVTKVGGFVAITVPPLKHQIVGGHVNLWNPGLLIYNMVLAGLDCSNIKIKTYGYNISAIVQKTNVQIPFDKLCYDWPDLTILNSFFPKEITYEKNCVFDGQINQLNW